MGWQRKIWNSTMEKEHAFEVHCSEIPYLSILYKYFDMQISQNSYDDNSLKK